jgi:rhamnose transport system permease protein
MTSARGQKIYLGRRGWGLTLVVLIVLASICASFASPLFLHVNQLLNSTGAMVVSGVLALGLAPIVLVGEIDISLTSNLAFCTVVLGLLSEAHVNPALIVLATLVTGLALGAFNGALVGYGGLPSLAVTLGTLGSYQGAAYLVGGTTSFTTFPSSIYAIGANTVGPVPISLLLFAALAIALTVLFRMTTIGRSLYAVGRASEAVRHSGISVAFVKMVTFCIGGLVAGLAALIFVGQYGSGGGDSASGTILTVVTAVALGGLDIYGGAGRISSLVLAIVLLDVIQNGMGLVNSSTTSQTIVIGLVLILSLLVPEMLGRLRGERSFGRRGLLQALRFSR